jgi:hypothetical protein
MRRWHKRSKENRMIVDLHGSTHEASEGGPVDNSDARWSATDSCKEEGDPRFAEAQSAVHPICTSNRCKSGFSRCGFADGRAYGEFGFFNPTGHSAVYLNHVCAETPVELRTCRAGEYGVVISRYHRIGGFDGIAVPVVAYLYAVDDVGDIPVTADAKLESRLRDGYRRKHLLLIAPDAPERRDEIPKGDWIQLIGASYDRKIYGFQIETTDQEDQHLVALLKQGVNVNRFNLFFHNCADFSRTLFNDYYPHAVRRNFFVDFGLTTPKQDARSLTKYAKRHRELNFSTFVIPQVLGPFAGASLRMAFLNL